MDERRRMTDREVYPAAWILVGMLALAYLIWRYALGSPTVSRCWVWEHWGLYCPGCGGTRAVPVLAALGGVYLVSQTVWRMRGRRGWVLRYDPRWPAVLAGLFLANCAVRNLLWLGFDIGI